MLLVIQVSLPTGPGGGTRLRQGRARPPAG